MPIEVISIGPPTLMLAGVTYALPAVNVTMYTDALTPTITQSNTSAFTANTAVTLTGGAATLSGGFVKAAANALVILKRN